MLSPGMAWLYYILLFITFARSSVKSYDLHNMCESKDCSFQMPGEKNATCKIYNTTACNSFDFSKWSILPVTKPTNESEASFNVSIMPIVHSHYSVQKRSAINVTFSSINTVVKGFVLNMSTTGRKHVCRIFDLGILKETEKNPISLYFDCLYGFPEDNREKSQFVFRSFPSNEELSYETFLPQYPDEKNACKWKPLIMVFLGSLALSIVEVKFTQAPLDVNVSSYVVTLIPELCEENKTVVVPANPEAQMLKAQFWAVERGSYSIAVRPEIESNRPCYGGETENFFVENNTVHGITILGVCGIVLLVILFVLAAYAFLRWLCRQRPVTSKIPVLIVYSFDCVEHKTLVAKFIQFLEKHYVDVFTIYGDEGDPKTWIQDMYTKARVIIVIISEGLFHTIDRSNNPPLKEDHKWRNQLSSSFSFITSQMYHSNETNKKFCKISFSYSDKQAEPKTLLFQPWGKTYVLPREINRFLRYIFNCAPRIKFLDVYPRMPIHDVLSLSEGIAWMESIEEMKQVIKRNEHLRYEDTVRPKLVVTDEQKSNRSFDSCLRMLFEDEEKFKCENEFEVDKDLEDDFWLLNVSDSDNQNILNNAENKFHTHNLPKIEDENSCIDYSYWEPYVSKCEGSSSYRATVTLK